MMHIGVLSTKIGVFCKNFALRFVTLQTNFVKIFLNFEKILKECVLRYHFLQNIFKPRRKNENFQKNFIKFFMKFIMTFFSKKIISRILLPGIDRSLYKRSWDAWSSVGFKNFQNLFSNFWGVTNLFAKFFQKMPIFVLRISMCITNKILP